MQNEYNRIIIETDEENPVIIATITDDDIELADGYRARLRPIYDKECRGRKKLRDKFSEAGDNIMLTLTT